MFSIALTTVKNRTEAMKLAQKLVSEKLAACVSIIPNVTSVYKWRGKVVRAREAMLMIKTSDKKLDLMIKRVKEVHSYEIPEVLVLRVERGSHEYMKWIEESLK